MNKETIKRIRQDSTIREGLAAERQKLWSRLSEMTMFRALLLERGESTGELDREYASVASKVERITTRLNGHATDTSIRRHSYEHDGGLYEQKRYDRLEVDVYLGFHEKFLDNQGRRRRRPRVRELAVA